MLTVTVVDAQCVDEDKTLCERDVHAVEERECVGVTVTHDVPLDEDEIVGDRVALVHVVEEMLRLTVTLTVKEALLVAQPD